jgi:hypothetical protein
MMRLRERSTFLGSIRLVSASDGSCAAGSEPFGGDGLRMAVMVPNLARNARGSLGL